MAKGTRMTSFSRFILFLIIIVPAAFIGSHFITGEEFSLDSLKNIFNKSNTDVEVTTKEEKDPAVENDLKEDKKETISIDEAVNEEVLTLKSRVMRLEEELTSKNGRIEELLKEVESMRIEKEKAIEEYNLMKKQLEEIKSALN